MVLGTNDRPGKVCLHPSNPEEPEAHVEDKPFSSAADAPSLLLSREPCFTASASPGKAFTLHIWILIPEEATPPEGREMQPSATNVHLSQH